MTIEDSARRLLATVQASRLSARNAGDPRADEIGSDAAAVCEHVLAGGDTDEAERMVHRISLLHEKLKVGRDSLVALRSELRGLDVSIGMALLGSAMEHVGDAQKHEAHREPSEQPGDDDLDADERASIEDEPTPMEPLAYVAPTPGWHGQPIAQQPDMVPIDEWEPPAETLMYYCERGETLATFIERVRDFHAAGKGTSMVAGAWDGGFRAWLDAVRAREQARASLPVDPAVSTQAVAPGSVETPPAKHSGPVVPWTGGVVGRRRATEPEILVSEWLPGPELLQSLTTALEGIDAVQAHLARFREANADKKQARWVGIFRKYLATVRGTPG